MATVFFLTESLFRIKSNQRIPRGPRSLGSFCLLLGPVFPRPIRREVELLRQPNQIPDRVVLRIDAVGVEDDLHRSYPILVLFKILPHLVQRLRRLLAVDQVEPLAVLLVVVAQHHLDPQRFLGFRRLLLEVLLVGRGIFLAVLVARTPGPGPPAGPGAEAGTRTGAPAPDAEREQPEDEQA